MATNVYLESLKQHLSGLFDVIHTPQRAEQILQHHAYSSNAIQGLLAEQYPQWINRM